MLKSEDKAFYARQGYLVLLGFKADAELAALRARAIQIADHFDPGEPGPGSGVFSTVDASVKEDAWFLASGDSVRCFLEKDALDAQGRLARPSALAVNKIGHALHELDPVFDAFSHGPALAQLAADLGLAQPRAVQSMLIFKPPGIGGEVCWHQDATYLITEPDSVTGFWFALEDANLDNGCLWVQPGGHRGPLRERFLRDGDTTRLERLDDTPWPTEREAVPLEVPAGTCVVLHGRLPHYSAPNRSAQSRQAYTLHVVDAASHWSAQNWLRPAAASAARGLG
ncbi:MAG TPA: phytanoyl-CoA dioxygenase family protein [Rubrivivax sp.]